MPTKREWTWYPKDIRVETKFGPIFLAFSGVDHIHADASGNGKFLTFRDRRFPYSLSLSCVDGKWVPSIHTSSPVYCDAPPTFKAAMTAEVVRAINAFVATPEGQDLPRQGAAASINNDLSSMEGEMAKLEAKLAELRTKHAQQETLLAKYQER